MLNKTNTSVEHIIAKIDNDFNPDNSDWIPRVGAWCIDVMNMLKIINKENKKVKVFVKDRIAYSNCPLNNTNFKVYTNKGCQIKEAKDNFNSSCGCNNDFSTGEESYTELANTVGVVINNKTQEEIVHSNHINSKDYSSRYNVEHYKINNQQDLNYVIVDCNKLELNFDTDCIYIEQEVVKTVKSDIYGCELPVIPNNGLLIEAITYYCMYKMLCRGYKHPVFNLNASQYGTNPYYMWIKLKDEAERSIINEGFEDIDDNNLWQSAFYINTFNPK